MRKILSIFLTVAMLLSLITVIPFGASAEIAKPQTITFDSVAQQSYYAAAKASSAKLEYSNSLEQGMAIKLDTIVSESNATWITAIRIAQVNSDGSVSAYKVKAGNKYTIKFKVKTENLQLDGGIAGLRLFHVSDAQNMSNFLANSKIAPKDWKNTYVSDIAGTTNGWVEITKTFTVPSDIDTMDELAISATFNYQGPWKASNQNLWIDDIIITPAQSEVEGYLSTFDTAEEVQADGVSYVTTKSIGKIVDTGDATQGKAFLFPEMSSKTNNNNWGNNIRLAGTKDGILTPYKVIPGETYNISFKYYINGSLGNTSSLNFYLLNVNSYNGGYCLAQSKTAAQDWPHIDLGSSDYSTTNSWITVKKTITIPTTADSYDELALIPIVSEWKINNVTMYIDDLKISQIVASSAFSTEVSFDEDYYYGNANCGYAKVEDTNDAEHGSAFKFTSFSKGGNAWPQNVRLTADNGTDPYYVKLNGRKYEISFDIKKDIADSDFYIAAHFGLPGSGLGKLDTDAANDYNPAKLKFAWTAKGKSDGWQRVTYTITTPAKANKGYDYSELILTCYNTDVWTAKDNQAVWIDNVSVKALTEVTINGTDVKWLAPETELSSLQTDLPGARVKNWYYDADFTKPVYSKYVGYYDSEIWAAYESVVIDFDNVDGFYSNIWADPTFNVVDYEGILNSKGLTNAKADGSVNSNSSWPDVLQLTNADGSALKTFEGHTYRLTMQVKAVPSLIAEHATLFVVYEKPGYDSSGPSTVTYPLVNDDYYYETAIMMKSAYRNSDGSYSDTPQWHEFVFEFEGLDSNGLPVYIVPWQVNGCAVTFDNISFVDLTAQKNVTDDKGNILASGYIGEDVVISAPADSGDTNFIKYTDANGDIVTEMMLKEDVQLTSVKSQIAVTATNADPENNMISFKVRYEGIYYSKIANSTDIAVKKVTVGNRRYDIDEIGVLVLPKENATETLTLDNYATLGAIKVANSDLKFVSTGDNSITINAGIITSKFTRNYTVVGYVKYSKGVIYSQNRFGLAENLNDASGLEETSALTFGNYKLVDNAEFNTDGDVSSDDFGFWLNKQVSTDGTMTKYSTTNNAYVEDGNMVLTSEVTSANTLDFAYMLGNKTFKHGYVEIRAKFAKDLAGCIWFNFPGIPQSEYVYPENDTDVYVNTEIDIVEFDSTDKFISTLHSWGTKDGTFGEAGQIRLEDVNGNNSGTACDLSEWHTFGIERTSEYIKIFVDGVLTFEYTLEEALETCTWGTNIKHTPNYNWQYRTENEVKALFDNPTYLILSISPTDLTQGATTLSYIDYVRYYE